MTITSVSRMEITQPTHQLLTSISVVGSNAHHREERCKQTLWRCAGPLVLLPRLGTKGNLFNPTNVRRMTIAYEVREAPTSNRHVAERPKPLRSPRGVRPPKEGIDENQVIYLHRLWGSQELSGRVLRYPQRGQGMVPRPFLQIPSCCQLCLPS